MRPKFARSGYPGCAPTVTCNLRAAASVCSMVCSLPACPPHATFADVMYRISSQSVPLASDSSDSPRSALISIVRSLIRKSPVATALARVAPGPLPEWSAPQTAPRREVRFAELTIPEAVQALREQEQWLREIFE